MQTHLRIASLWGCAMLVAACPLGAQDGSQVEQLQRQLQRLQETLEKNEQEHRRQIEALQRQLDALRGEAAKAAQPPAPASETPPAPAKPQTEPKQAWSPTDPIRLIGNQRNYLNLALDALMAAGGSTADDVSTLETGGHDPQQNGFTLQGLEMVFDGAVDAYFRARASLLFQIDSSGESQFELEEAYAETTSLPYNFQVRAGQYMTDFGRLNPTHPHTWSFVDMPLVNARLLGGDGLRNPGVRVSWLMPTKFYSELFLGIQNSQGETAYSFLNEEELFGRTPVDRGIESLGDLLYVPRYAASFELTESQTALVGASAGFGPNASGVDTRTEVYGVDLFWKWKSPRHHGGFPFVSWQTEGMLRRYEAGADPANGLPAEMLEDYGAYSQVAWGFEKGWVAALRGDWVSGDEAAYYPDPNRDTRWRISPNLTWYPTEYSKLRLQYNYDDRKNIGVDHSVWLQLEFLLGAHAAHKF